MTDDKKQRQKDLMFDTSRSTVLVNTIWDDVSHETIKQYQSLVNDISRMSCLFLMLSLRLNVELNQLDVIYGKVDTRLRGYMV